MEQLIDIVIPVYNGEKYIENLILQLENQTFKGFRAIFVDDGSKDNSFKLLSEKLPKANFESLLLQQENKGASVARNTGLRKVTAPWIAFADCDDFFLPEFLEYYYRAVTETGADLAIASLKIIEEGVKFDIPPVGELEYQCLTAKEAMYSFTEEWRGVCCLLINREKQQQYKLFEDEECIYGEDVPFVAQVIASAEKVVKISNITYFYPTIQGSLSHSGSRKKFLSGIDAFKRMVTEFENRTEPACKAFLECGCARYYIAILRKAAMQLSYKEFESLAKDINFDAYKSQVSKLSLKPKLASVMFLISKRMFYFTIRRVLKS